MRITSARRLAILAMLTTLLLGLSSHRMAAQTPGPQDALWDAAKQGDSSAVAAALAFGALVDSLDTRRSRNGRRALNWATWYNHPVVVRLLVAQGATINLANLTGFTPLHHAAENGSVEAGRVLLELGADWTLANNGGLRPLDVARERGQLEMVALLDTLPTKR
jgi:ankyrin repeat protein